MKMTNTPRIAIGPTLLALALSANAQDAGEREGMLERIDTRALSAHIDAREYRLSPALPVQGLPGRDKGIGRLEPGMHVRFTTTRPPHADVPATIVQLRVVPD